MKRTMFCVLGFSVFVTMRVSAQERPSSTPTSATIVKIATFANQSGPIPETTIFTPTADAFFRANIFGQVVATNAGNPTSGDVAYFCPALSFTDDAGAGQTGGGFAPEDSARGCVPVIGTLTNSSASTTYFFRAKANAPIAFSTILMYGGPPVAPYEYNVYIVLERF